MSWRLIDRGPRGDLRVFSVGTTLFVSSWDQLLRSEDGLHWTACELGEGVLLRRERH